MRELLLEKIDSIPEDSLLINRYLQAFHEHKPEGLDPEIPTGFQFENDTIPEFTLQEGKVFKLVLDKISTPINDYSDGFVTFGIDEKLGVIAISVSTPDPELSLKIIDILQEKTVQRIDRNTLFSPEVAYEKMSIETDSLADNYRTIYYELNRTRDTYERYLKQPDSLISEPRRKAMHNKIIRLEVEAEINKTGYLASLEQLKVSKIDMDNETVLMQLVDKTIPPIDPYQPSAKVAAVKGGIGGFALALFLIVSFKLFKDVLREVDEGGDQDDAKDEGKEKKDQDTAAGKSSVVWYRRLWLRTRSVLGKPILFIRGKLPRIRLPRLREKKNSSK
ncbi:MAG: hypothetical protein KTR30_22945 [Saprospiraceae bacterium]|nr:hypothetical protein [Saprospiraceae bacterium]